MLSPIVCPSLVLSVFNRDMSLSSKRQCSQNPHAAQFKIICAPTSTPQPSATSCTIIFDRHASGRLGQQTEISEVSISAEDIAVLAPTEDVGKDNKGNDKVKPVCVEAPGFVTLPINIFLSFSEHLSGLVTVSRYPCP